MIPPCPHLPPPAADSSSACEIAALTLGARPPPPSEVPRQQAAQSISSSHAQQLSQQPVAAAAPTCSILDPQKPQCQLLMLTQPETVVVSLLIDSICPAVNLSAPFLLSEALLPLLAKKEGEQAGGSIIHISSTRALQSEPHSEVSCDGFCVCGRGRRWEGGKWRVPKKAGNHRLGGSNCKGRCSQSHKAR